MAKPPTLMIAVGLGRPHGEEAQDEDGLDRERDDGDGGDGDLATEAVLGILDGLKQGKAAAVRNLRAFTSALEAMCDAFMERDYHAVGDAADAARDALHEMISDE